MEITERFDNTVYLTLNSFPQPDKDGEIIRKTGLPSLDSLLEGARKRYGYFVVKSTNDPKRIKVIFRGALITEMKDIAEWFRANEHVERAATFLGSF